MDKTAFAALLRAQAGVITRRQAFALEGRDGDIERMLRKGQLARIHDGVYVDHTGPPSLLQRDWAAVLRHEPSVLSGESALRVHRVRGRWQSSRTDQLIEVAVALDRHPRKVSGIQLVRTVHYDRVARPELSPPRVQLEHAAIQVASAARDTAAAVAVLADVCQAGRTTVSRLLSELGQLDHLPKRAFLRDVLTDVASGAFSVLERRYLREVERAHGLPTPMRQHRDRTICTSLVSAMPAVVYRDVDHSQFGVLIELDGRLGHEWAEDRWDDIDRDISSALDGRMTIRCGWRQVLEPCRLAAMVALVLRSRGWQEWPTTCADTCQVEFWLNRGAHSAPTGDNAPRLPDWRRGA